MLVLNVEEYLEKYCEYCGEEYTDNLHKWCKSCQIDYLKNDFTNWTSGNNKIDVLIQEKQLKINNSRDIVFEWIPYNQFSNVREVENGFGTAVWKNGPLEYDAIIRKYEHRNPNIIIALKCLCDDTQNVINNEFLNEV